MGAARKGGPSGTLRIYGDFWEIVGAPITEKAGDFLRNTQTAAIMLRVVGMHENAEKNPASVMNDNADSSNPNP